MTGQAAQIAASRSWTSALGFSDVQSALRWRPQRASPIQSV